MFTRPTHLNDRTVVEALTTRWDLHVDRIEFAPVGFGSSHWWVEAEGRRWFVTADDLEFKRRSLSEPIDEPRRRLRATLTTARQLADGGLDFVVAPVPSRSGQGSTSEIVN